MQTINVNLTQENISILKRPSKFFNKIKAVLDGGMTPTESQQAEVMLSALQRINMAFRKNGLANLVNIMANDKVIYEDTREQSNDLEHGKQALLDSLHTEEIKRLDNLRMAVDESGDTLRYLILVDIIRKPRKNQAPVVVKVIGFMNDYKKEINEADDSYSARVTPLISQEWGEPSAREGKLKKIESEFTNFVDLLQKEIDGLFPALSERKSEQRIIRRRAYDDGSSSFHARYSNSLSYLPIWYIAIDAAADISEIYPDSLLDESDSWLSSDSFNDEVSSTTWIGDSSFDSSESSCGSSCGGGCGGD